MAPEIYRKVQELEEYAEAIDVENGEWRGYDESGKHVAFTVVGDAVRLLPGPGIATNELADWLRSSKFLESSRNQEWLQNAPLPDLVAAFDSEEKAWPAQLPVTRFRRWLTMLIARGVGR